MLDDEWYVPNNSISSHHHDIRDLSIPNNLLLHHHHQHPVDSTSSCSPSSSVFNNLNPSQLHFFLQPNPGSSSFLNVVSNNPEDHGFDLGEIGFLDNQATNASPLLSRKFLGSKLLRPLDSFPSVGAQPTLFQKRAALRKNLADNGGDFGALGGGSIDGSALIYDSDEFTDTYKVEETLKNGGSTSNANSTITGGDQKGKKKGLPAKNLMAERRCQKKLRDRLYMLQSVVPKISKMDRASILGDAIEYLKELLQRINDLRTELESNPGSSSVTPTTSFRPLTPTPATLPCHIKDELCPTSLLSPNGQPARQCKEGQDIHPEQIKAVLLDSAGFNNNI
ncbi:Transcription factor ICE1 [Hibiscus syriacus]|uniref:Transcription factor ICE1 n=1 Tax=Hibiscus syriacus TaxID=106335 RepID=A0A6A2WW15_HIBSY|nr:Transcription factor ICE1 [Hibiscus syriacus]